MIKQAWLAVVVLIACIELTAPAIAADDEGAADHLLVSRYPGQEIRWYAVENFLPYKVPAGPVTGYRAIGDYVSSWSEDAPLSDQTPRT